MKIQSLIAVSLMITATGCATLFSGTTQNINVQAIDSETNTPLEGVFCTLTDGKGMKYKVPTNQGEVTVQKGKDILKPECKKEGYVQSSAGVGESFDKIGLVNILFWPGFIVDGVSGAMHEYPSHVVVTMEKKK